MSPVVVAPSRPALRWRGDTIEYNMSGMKMGMNESLTGMLVRLPGLQVSPDGTITYNGERIKKILIDGEEVSGYDPVVIARSLDAAMVAKVEILDHKSDGAKFSGVDDGIRIKTLNVILKERVKHGPFSKIEGAGGGLKNAGIYDAGGIFGLMNGSRQVMVLARIANTGKVDVGGDVDGPITNTNGFSADDPLGASAGGGIPAFAGSAVHYSNGRSEANDHLLMNYQYGHLLTHPFTKSEIAQVLADSVYLQTMDSRSRNRLDQQLGNAEYDFSLDSVSALRVSVGGNRVQSWNEYQDSGYNSFNKILASTQGRSIQDSWNQLGVNGSIGFRIRGRRNAERLFSVTAGYSNSMKNTDGYMNASEHFIPVSGRQESYDTIDQREAFLNSSQNVGGTVNYRQPIGKENRIGFGYSLYLTGNRSDQATFEKADGKYDVRVDSLSGKYFTQLVMQEGFASLSGSRNQFTYMVLAGMQRNSYRQNAFAGDSAWGKHFDFPLVRSQWVYTLNHSSHFSLNFENFSQLPSPGQLQAISNNSNPLEVVKGNPNLKPTSMQSLSVQFSRIGPLLLDVSCSSGWTEAAISTRISTDSLGRQLSTPVNVSGTRLFGLNVYATRSFQNWTIGMHLNLEDSRVVNYLDEVLNQTDRYSAGAGFSIGRDVPDQYSMHVNSDFVYTDTRNSVNHMTAIRYLTQNHSGSLAILFFRGYDLRTDVIYTSQQGVAEVSPATSILLLNASITRSLVAGRLLIRLKMNNLLNENAGISRTVAGNIFTQSSTNALGRYWMAGAIWRFDKWKK